MLTADEMSLLDLRSTELVVLSACESGLGATTRFGEGVLGQPRALMLAGAQAVIMSLWPVPDAETAALMSDLARRLSRSRRVRPSEELRAVQLKALRRARAEHGSAQPWLWAGWVPYG